MTSTLPSHLVVGILLLLIRGLVPLAILACLVYLGLRIMSILPTLIDRGSLLLVYKRSVYTREFLPDLLEVMNRESKKGIRIINITFIVLSILILPSSLINPILSAAKIGDTLEKSADSVIVLLPTVVPVACLLALSYILVRMIYTTWVNARFLQKRHPPRRAIEIYLTSEYLANLLLLVGSCITLVLVVASLRLTYGAIFPILINIESLLTDTMHFDLPDNHFYASLESSVRRVFGILVSIYSPYATLMYAVIFSALGIPYLAFRGLRFAIVTTLGLIFSMLATHYLDNFIRDVMKIGTAAFRGVYLSKCIHNSDGF